MERKRIKLKLNPTPSKVFISIAAATTIYEITAVIVNKNFGAGLPYFPWQVTPSNIPSAAGIFGTSLGVSYLTASVN